MAFSKATKKQVLVKADYKCCWCKNPGYPEIHHIKSKKDGGSDEIENAAPLCPGCHEKYGDTTKYRNRIKEKRDHLYGQNETKYAAKDYTCTNRLNEIEHRLRALEEKARIDFLNVAQECSKTFKNKFGKGVEPDKIMDFTILDIRLKKAMEETAKAYYEIHGEVENIEYLIIIGNLNLFDEEEEKALGYYDKALKYDSNRADIWNNMGVAYKNLRQYQKSLECYDKAIEINPKYVIGLTNKGATLGRLDRYKDSLECQNKALEIDPNYILALSNKGASLAILERFEEAIESYNKAIELKPNFAMAWVNKGTTLGKVERYKESLECLDKALELNPKLSAAWNNKAVQLIKLKQYDEALDCINKALEINPEYAEAWANKAEIYEKTESFDEALEFYEKALKYHPEPKTLEEGILADKEELEKKIKEKVT